MKLSNLRPTTVAIAVAALLALLVGATTDNAGFQAAGWLFGTVAVLVAVSDVRAGGRSRDR